MKLFIHSLKHLFDFQGRASRKEYWLFNFMSWFIPFLLTQFLKYIIGVEIEAPDDPEFTWGSISGVYFILFVLYFIALIPVSIIIAIRRLHDIGFSGYIMFLLLFPVVGAMIIFVMTLLPGEVGSNDYGEDIYKNKYLSGTESEEEAKLIIRKRKKKIKIETIITTIIASILTIFLTALSLVSSLLSIDGDGNIVPLTKSIKQDIGGELIYDMKAVGKLFSKQYNIGFQYVSGENDTISVGSVNCTNLPLLENLQAEVYNDWIMIPVNADYSTKLLMHNFDKDRTLIHNIDYKFVSANIYGKEKDFLKKSTYFFISEVYEDLVTIVMIDPKDISLDGNLDPEKAQYVVYQINGETGELSYYNMQFE